MVPAEPIEAALREHLRIRPQERATAALKAGEPILVTGGEAADAALIALKALDDAGMVVVPANAHAWLVRVAEYVSMGRRYVDVEPYPDAIARLALGALPERTDTREP